MGMKKNVGDMRYFRASSSKPIDKCIKEVRESDIYVGILGTRYGSVARNGKSYTQIEFEEAVRQDIERMVYLLDEEKHPVAMKYVDTGKKARKLKKFKEKTKKYMIRKFTSPEDLKAKFIADLIRYLEEEGGKVESALKKHRVGEFEVSAGYSSSFSGSSIDISELLEMKENGKFVVEDKYIESVLSAAYIAKNIYEERYGILKGFATFEKEVWNILERIIENENINSESLSKEIKSSTDTLKVRLMFKIVRAASCKECLDAVCSKMMEPKKYHKILKSYDLQVTPFDKVAEKTIKSISEGGKDTVKKYRERSKRKKNWRAHTVFKKSLK